MKSLEIKNKTKFMSVFCRLLLFISIFFKNLTSNIDLIKNFPSYFDSYFDAIQLEMTLSSSQIIGIAVVSTIITCLLILLFWEFIFRFYFELVARKIGVFMKREDFVFNMRVFVIFINVLIGLFALALFFKNDLYYIIYFPIEYAVAFVCALAFYKHLTKFHIGKEFKAKTTIFIVVPYFIYNVLLLAFRMINAFGSKDIDWNIYSYTVSTLIYAGLLLISIVISYLLYLKRKNLEEKELPPEDPFESGGLGGQYSAFSEFKSKK